MFHVGQKVICIDDVRREGCPEIPPGLVKGAVYTVIGLGDDGYSVAIVTLAEVKPMGKSPGFFRDRFRPVAEPKTDISILYRIAEEAARTRKVTA
jgi:hypothetical protein